jgi:predicted O-methyltransferase YrrM
MNCQPSQVMVEQNRKDMSWKQTFLGFLAKRTASRKVLEWALAKLVNIERRLVKYAFKPSEYSFTKDDVSAVAPIWTQHLSEIRGKENIHMLEVGSFEGRSAIWFLQNVLIHPSSTITCVDIFYSSRVPFCMREIRFDHNIAASGFSSRVTKVKARSQELLELLREDTYNIIYIDGSHRAADVQSDASLSWPLLKRNGIIIFDDYLWRLEWPVERRPKMGIDNFLSSVGSQLEILHKGRRQVIGKRLS